MHLREYKPVNPESEVFLKELSDFLDSQRDQLENQGLTFRHLYKYTDTLVPGPDHGTGTRIDLHAWGHEILFHLHKLWNVDYRKRDIHLLFWYGGLAGKVGYDATFGIGGDILLHATGTRPIDNETDPLDTGFATYKLRANGVVLNINYGRRQLRYSDPSGWVVDDAVSIKVEKE